MGFDSSGADTGRTPRTEPGTAQGGALPCRSPGRGGAGFDAGAGLAIGSDADNLRAVGAASGLRRLGGARKPFEDRLRSGNAPFAAKAVALVRVARRRSSRNRLKTTAADLAAAEAVNGSDEIARACVILERAQRIASPASAVAARPPTRSSISAGCSDGTSRCSAATAARSRRNSRRSEGRRSSRSAFRRIRANSGRWRRLPGGTACRSSRSPTAWRLRSAACGRDLALLHRQPVLLPVGSRSDGYNRSPGRYDAGAQRTGSAARVRETELELQAFGAYLPESTGVAAKAASTASPSRSTIVSTAVRSTMKGGASSTWSPRAPSIVPPEG